MAKYALEALLQLQSIRLDERFSKTQRQKMAGELLNAINLLEKHPAMAPRDAVGGTREKLVSPFIIVYRETDNGLEVVNIWHERQSRDTL